MWKIYFCRYLLNMLQCYILWNNESGLEKIFIHWCLEWIKSKLTITNKKGVGFMPVYCCLLPINHRFSSFWKRVSIIMKSLDPESGQNAALVHSGNLRVRERSRIRLKAVRQKPKRIGCRVGSSDSQRFTAIFIYIFIKLSQLQLSNYSI